MPELKVFKSETFLTSNALNKGYSAMLGMACQGHTAVDVDLNTGYFPGMEGSRACVWSICACATSVCNQHIYMLASV